MSLLTAVLPAPFRWLVLLLAFAFVAMIFQMRGERIAGQRHLDYVGKQAVQSVKIAQMQAKVAGQIEIKYRDRILPIYVKGDVIEKEVPVYVTQADNDHCAVNAGFVRVYDAAWTGEPAGPPTESDRGSTGISLAEIAEVDAFNAKACRAWREQALGLRELYQNLKSATADPQ